MEGQIEHPQLGKIQGTASDGLVNFLGLKYATLANRFATAQLAGTLSENIVDATKYGPQAVSPPDAVHMEHAVIQMTLPVGQFPGMSDVDCLNLNITMPVEAQKTSSKGLPVMVWIHGGGFQFGANWYPQTDLSRFIRLSAEQGKPIIGVRINYRLGLCGFLSSKELQDAGFRPNNGLGDQRTALCWVRKYITGFGGNPDNITVMGQSAGSISTAYLMTSEEKLANRLIFLAASPPLMKPADAQAADSIYDSVVRALNFEGMSAKERVKELLALPSEDLLSKVSPSIQACLVIDGDIVPSVPTFEAISSKRIEPTFPLPGKNWCESIVVGNCSTDSNAYFYSSLSHRQTNLGPTFCKSIQKSLASNPEACSRLLAAYDLDSKIEDKKAVGQILKFANDLCFYLPATALTTGFPGPAYRLKFEEGNPWDGPFKGHAGHCTDFAFLFQNYNKHLDEKQRGVAIAFAKDIIAFMNGDAPWPAFGEGKECGIVYGGGNRNFVTSFMESEERGVKTMMEVGKEVG